MYFVFDKKQFTQEDTLQKIKDIKYVLDNYSKNLQLIGFMLNNRKTHNPLIFADSVTPTYRIMYNLNRLQFTTNNVSEFTENKIHKVIVNCKKVYDLKVKNLKEQLITKNILAINDNDFTDDSSVLKNIRKSDNNTLELFFTVIDKSMTQDKIDFMAKTEEESGNTGNIFISINMIKKMDIKYIYTEPDKYIIRTTLPVINFTELKEILESYDNPSTVVTEI
jgi:hypothetical protein